MGKGTYPKGWSRSSSVSSSKKSTPASSGGGGRRGGAKIRAIKAKRKATQAAAASGRPTGKSRSSSAMSSTEAFIIKQQAAQKAVAERETAETLRSGKPGKRTTRERAAQMVEAAHSPGRMVEVSSGMPRTTAAHLPPGDARMHREKTPSIPITDVRPGMEGRSSYEVAMHRIGQGGEREGKQYTKSRSAYERAVSGEDRKSITEIKALGRKMEKDYTAYEKARGTAPKIGATQRERKTTWAAKSHATAETIRGFDMFPSEFDAETAKSGTKSIAPSIGKYTPEKKVTPKKKGAVGYLKEGVAQNIEMFGSAPTTLKYGAKVVADDPGILPALGIAAFGGMVKGAKADPLQTLVTLGITAGASKGIIRGARAQPIKKVTYKHGAVEVIGKGDARAYFDPFTGATSVKTPKSSFHSKYVASPKRMKIPDRDLSLQTTKDARRDVMVQSVIGKMKPPKPAKGKVEFGISIKEQLVTDLTEGYKPPKQTQGAAGFSMKPAQSRSEFGFGIREQIVSDALREIKPPKPAKGKVDLGISIKEQMVADITEGYKPKKQTAWYVVKPSKGKAELGVGIREQLISDITEGYTPPKPAKGKVEFGFSARDTLLHEADSRIVDYGFAPIKMTGGKTRALSTLAMVSGDMFKVRGRPTSPRIPAEQTYFSPAEAMKMFETPVAIKPIAKARGAASRSKIRYDTGIDIAGATLPIVAISSGRQTERLYEPLGMQMPELTEQKIRPDVAERTKEREKVGFVTPHVVDPMLKLDQMIGVRTGTKERTAQKTKQKQIERTKTKTDTKPHRGMYPDKPIVPLPKTRAIPIMFGDDVRRKARPKKRVKRDVSFEDIINPIKAAKDFMR